MEGRLHELRKFASLAALEDDQLQRLSYHFRSRDAGPGEAILTQGEKTTTLYFIRSGGLECVADRRGAELRLVQIGADSSCGEVAAITGNAMNYSVRALRCPATNGFTRRFPAPTPRVPLAPRPTGHHDVACLSLIHI